VHGNKDFRCSESALRVHPVFQHGRSAPPLPDPASRVPVPRSGTPPHTALRVLLNHMNKPETRYRIETEKGIAHGKKEFRRRYSPAYVHFVAGRDPGALRGPIPTPVGPLVLRSGIIFPQGVSLNTIIGVTCKATVHGIKDFRCSPLLLCVHLVFQHGRGALRCPIPTPVGPLVLRSGHHRYQWYQKE